MKSFRTLIPALCILLCLFLLAACQPQPVPSATAGATQQSTAAPTDAATPEPSSNAMKAGDVYRIFLCTNMGENEYVDGATIGATAVQVRERWQNFQDEYGVTVTWVAAGSVADWLNSVPASAAAGAPLGDIYHMGGPFAIPNSLTYGGVAPDTYYENLLDYAEYTNFTDNGYWDQSAQEAVGYYNDKLLVVVPQYIGFNMASLNQVCFFNTALIEAGGHTADEIYELYDKKEWTFEKFRSIAVDCADPDRGVYGLPITRSVMSMLSLICANDAQILTPNAQGVPEFSADSPKALKAINFFVDMCKTEGLVDMDGSIAQEEAPEFNAGKVALMLTYANRVTEGEGAFSGAMYQEENLSYGIVLPPIGPHATDYRSDRNWYAPLGIFKGHSNPAGLAQCLSIYMAPEYTVTSDESMQLLESDATIYFKDSRSIQVLKDAAAHNVTTAYMVYWNSAGNVLCNLTSYGIEKWISGESTPEVDYEAGKNAVNSALAGLFK